MANLHPTGEIRYRTVDGLTVLLDLRTGSYVVLDRVATAMWEVLTSIPDPGSRIAELERRFDAPAARLEADLAEFAGSCMERGFLQAAPPPRDAPPPRARPSRVALTLRAWLSLLATTRSLAGRGFSETYRRYARRPLPECCREEMDALVARAERAFSRAENFFMLRNAPRDCLPRSLALYRFLRSVGVPAEHCIGVQRFPFEAHAWVEAGGRVVHDSRDFVGGYAELARIRA